MTKGKISILVPDLSSRGTTRGYIIAQGLKKIGYQVKICGFIFDEHIYPEPPYGIPISCIHGNKLPNLISRAFTLSKQIDGDIIYAIKPQLTSFGLGLFKAWRGKKPLILDFDDWEMAQWGGDDWQYRGNLFSDIFASEGELRKPEHPFYLAWLEKSWDKVNALTVSSKFLEYRYGGNYLPNVVDTSIYDPAKFDAQQIKASQGLEQLTLLMYQGTAKPNQGWEDILNALVLLDNPEIKLVLVGGNRRYEDYRQQLYQKYQQHLLLTSNLPFNELGGILSMADMMIFTPPNSPEVLAKFPLELLEAMAMAKPIIATQVGEISTILGDTGYLIPAHNNKAEAIAQQIKYILENRAEAGEKGRLARKRCLEHYSMEQLTTNLEKIMTIATYSL